MAQMDDVLEHYSVDSFIWEMVKTDNPVNLVNPEKMGDRAEMVAMAELSMCFIQPEILLRRSL
jgi:hypothetical protein